MKGIHDKEWYKKVYRRDSKNFKILIGNGAKQPKHAKKGGPFKLTPPKRRPASKLSGPGGVGSLEEEALPSTLDAVANVIGTEIQSTILDPSVSSNAREIEKTTVKALKDKGIYGPEAIKFSKMYAKGMEKVLEDIDDPNSKKAAALIMAISGTILTSGVATADDVLDALPPKVRNQINLAKAKMGSAYKKIKNEWDNLSKKAAEDAAKKKAAEEAAKKKAAKDAAKEKASGVTAAVAKAKKKLDKLVAALPFLFDSDGGTQQIDDYLSGNYENLQDVFKQELIKLSIIAKKYHGPDTKVIVKSGRAERGHNHPTGRAADILIKGLTKQQTYALLIVSIAKGLVEDGGVGYYSNGRQAEYWNDDESYTIGEFPHYDIRISGRNRTTTSKWFWFKCQSRSKCKRDIGNYNSNSVRYFKARPTAGDDQFQTSAGRLAAIDIVATNPLALPRDVVTEIQQYDQTIGDELLGNWGPKVVSIVKKIINPEPTD